MQKDRFLTNPNFLFYIQKREQEDATIHKHEFLELVYVWKGEATHYINEEKLKIKQGDVFFCNRSDRHGYENTQNLVIVNILFLPAFLGSRIVQKKEFKLFFDFTFLMPLSEETGPYLRLCGITEFKVRMLIEDMLTEFQNRPRGFQEIIKNDLANLLITLGRAYEKELEKSEELREKMKLHHRKFEESVRYVEENYAREISLPKVAGIACFTPNYFSEIFYKITGKHFSAYINDLRMEHAGLLLKNTQLNIGVLARQCGFVDYRHFERVFKKTFGLSPNAYRKKVIKT